MNKRSLAKSEPLKRKRYNVERNEEEEKSDMCYLVMYDSTNEYSVVNDSQIKISQSNTEKGTVVYRKIEYDVTILKKGTLKYCNEKALRYQRMEPLISTDEAAKPKVKVHKS